MYSQADNEPGKSRYSATGILDTPMRPALSGAPGQLTDAEASEDVEVRLAALKTELDVG